MSRFNMLVIANGTTELNKLLWPYDIDHNQRLIPVQDEASESYKRELKYNPSLTFKDYIARTPWFYWYNGEVCQLINPDAEFDSWRFEESDERYLRNNKGGWCSSCLLRDLDKQNPWSDQCVAIVLSPFGLTHMCEDSGIAEIQDKHFNNCDPEDICYLINCHC